MKKRIIIDENQIDIEYVLKTFPNDQELSEIIIEIRNIEERLKKYNLIDYKIKKNIYLPNETNNEKFYVKVIKVVLKTLPQDWKEKLLKNKPEFNYKKKNLIFKIDEIFKPIIQKARKNIEETAKLLGAPIKITWYHQTNIKLREKVEEIRSNEVKQIYDDIKLKEYKEAPTSVNSNLKKEKNYWKNKKPQIKVQQIKDIRELKTASRVVFKGNIAIIKVKNSIIFFIEDMTDSIKVITYKPEDKVKVSKFRIGDTVYVEGSIKHDKKNKETVVWFENMIKYNEEVNEEEKKDKKRFELHTHTKMSALDGVASVYNYYIVAKSLGHPGIAITDHDSVQAFPEAAEIQKKDKAFKFIFGCEFTILENELDKIVSKNLDLEKSEYIIFDFETTGLYCQFDEIMEVSMKRINQFGDIDESLNFFIKQEKLPSQNQLKFTNIKQEELEKGLTKKEAAEKIFEFINKNKNTILVAHNVYFDYSFLRKLFKEFNLNYENLCFLDTLAISRFLFSNKKNFTLGKIARELKISYDSKQAHSAIYDVDVLTQIWIKLLKKMIDEYKVQTVDDIYKIVSSLLSNCTRRHINVLCKNEQGKVALYELISLSRIKYLGVVPQLPLEEIMKRRENLLIGSGCWNGLVFQAALEGNDNLLRKRIQTMDYIEIQPPEVYNHLLKDTLMTIDDIKTVIKKIVTIANQENKLIVVTSDAHFSIPNEKLIRDIYINTEGLRGARHDFYRSLATRFDSNFVVEGPNQIYRSSTNLIDEMQFLKSIINVEKIVTTNTLEIASMCENFEIQPKKLYSPIIDNLDADTWVKNEVKKGLEKIYSKGIPEIIQKRANIEVNLLIEHNFVVNYYISAILIKEINNKNALVGSRGSVGSSFVAYLLGITEVNPLRPHYYCKNDGYYEEFDDIFVSCFDMPIKECPRCKTILESHGMNIPFETFLGLKGDKVPDIDLNIPSEHQILSHNYIRDLYGKENVFRAGTISKIADKTAYAIFMKYNDKLPLEKKIRNKDYVIAKIEGVKRTTGKHPGGIIIVPKNKSVHYFTPKQYPSNRKDEDWFTTHYDFNFLHNNLLKLDLLGHKDPSMIGHLMRLTNKSVKDIDYKDPNLIKVFKDCSILGITPEDIAGEKTGAIALPEFGTKKTRSIIKNFNPTTFSDLVRISGISHGQGVWKGNIDALVKKGTKMEDLVTCRDDIMLYLHKHKIPLEICFTIMEKIRKGSDLTHEQIKIMHNHEVPQFYIDMCKKINYLFPKAHAVAYVLMAYRCAYYKLYYKIPFYCAYFTQKSKKFPYLQSQFEKNKLIKTYIDMSENRRNKKFDKDVFNDLEVVMEMKARNINIRLPELNLAQSYEFIELKDSKEMMIPFSTLDGFGKIGEKIVEERERGFFKSYQDFESRVKLNTNQKKLLKELHLADF